MIAVDMRGEKTMNNQEIKADAGKLPITLVPREIIRNIAAIRAYGKKKYGSSESWRDVELERYQDAFFRHWLAYLDDPHGLDEESGYPHLWHAACNMAFLCELEKGKFKDNKLDLSKIKKPILQTSITKDDPLIWYDNVKPDVVPFSKTKVDSDGFDWENGDFVDTELKTKGD